MNFIECTKKNVHDRLLSEGYKLLTTKSIGNKNIYTFVNDSEKGYDIFNKFSNKDIKLTNRMTF